MDLYLDVFHIAQLWFENEQKNTRHRLNVRKYRNGNDLGNTCTQNVIV